MGGVVTDGGRGSEISIEKIHAVFRQIWPNNRLAPPMKNLGSTTEEKESWHRWRYGFVSVIFPLLSFWISCCNIHLVYICSMQRTQIVSQLGGFNKRKYLQAFQHPIFTARNSSCGKVIFHVQLFRPLGRWCRYLWS